MLKRLLQISTVLIVMGLAVGIAFQVKNNPIAEKIIGISMLALVLFLLPLFLYYRYRHKKWEDYILTQEKMDYYVKKMKE